MSNLSAKMLVLAGEKFACIKIIGRANFNSSIDFRTLLNELLQKDYGYFVLDLSECMLMDSTFLGVLAGFGLKLGGASGEKADQRIELLNPNERITELLENLGVLHLFRVTQGETSVCYTDAKAHPSLNPTKEDLSRACLEAHQTLMNLNPENAARFKDLAQFLAEDLRKSGA
jgi:anti-sigma B factor antagonist